MIYDGKDFLNLAKKEVELSFRKDINLKEINNVEVIDIELKDKRGWGDVRVFVGNLKVNNKIKIPYKLSIILIDEDDLGWGEIKSSKLDLNLNKVLVLKNGDKEEFQLTVNEFKSFIKKELSSSDEQSVFTLIEQFKKDAKVIGDKIKDRRYNGKSHEYDYIIDKLFINFKREGVRLYFPSDNIKVRCFAGFEQGINYVVAEYIYDKEDGGINNDLLIYYKYGNKKVKVTFSKNNGYSEEDFYKLKDGYREKLKFLTKGK